MADPKGASAADPAVSDNSGTIRMHLDIDVPPGPGGSAPNLRLVYSSTSRDGAFGVGWDMQIPEIRCSNRFGIPDYSNCSSFEYQGNLLVPSDTVPNRFHTFVENFETITYLPALDSWVVESVDGSRLIYGEDEQHRVSTPSGTARWLLHVSMDVFNNSIYFEWDTVTDRGTAYLTSISYGDGAGAQGGPREIRFLREPRPDTRLVFTGGVATELTERVREIQVFGHGEIARRYVLGYGSAEISYSTNRSRLSQVQEFGTDCADPADDPITHCTGLPPVEYDYRDTWAVSGTPSDAWQSVDDYRIPLGAYEYPYWPLIKAEVPRLIGDLNGDGLPDQIEFIYINRRFGAPYWIRVLINTGSGFTESDSASTDFKASLESLTFDLPRLEYAQIPAPEISPLIEFVRYGMCSLNKTSRTAVLIEELSHRGLNARVGGGWNEILGAEAGSPVNNYIEPRPSVRLQDIDGDGFAELVVSTRLAGAKRHLDCDGTVLSEPDEVSESKLTVVFRNTGTGWANDAQAQKLANGLPPFEELVALSSYQTELETPTTLYDWTPSGGAARTACENLSQFGFERWTLTIGGPNPPEFATDICHTFVPLHPTFADFNGDGLVDLAVLVRDNPDSISTGMTYLPPPGLPYDNRARTKIYLQNSGQTPEEPRRWIPAAEFDLPSGMLAPNQIAFDFGFAHMSIGSLDDPYSYGHYCRSVDPDFPLCGPNTVTGDLGVRFVDLNADGLIDVAWRGSARPDGAVLLNMGTGSGATVSSAWCASEENDALWVGAHCPEAGAYIPPDMIVENVNYVGDPSNFPLQHGFFGDLNGDGYPDFARLSNTDGEFEAWLQDPGAQVGENSWIRDTRFDPPITARSVNHPIWGDSVTPGLGQRDFIPGWQLLDLDGDGSADVVGDLWAFLSKVTHSDLVSETRNGQGGVVSFEYTSAAQQRDDLGEAKAALEVLPGSPTPEGGDATLWTNQAVVRSITRGGPGQAEATTSFQYSRPRTCRHLRSSLGFRTVTVSRPGGEEVQTSYYQDHGRAGLAYARTITEGTVPVHEASWRWDLVSDVPGSSSASHNARIAESESTTLYASVAGAIRRQLFQYDDVYGYNFVSERRSERPTSTLIEMFLPDSEPSIHVFGRVAQATATDGTGDLLADVRFSYVDLDGDLTGTKVASRSAFVAARRGAPGSWITQFERRYDIHGNVIEERTPSPSGTGLSVTQLCYDGEGGWCPSPAGHTSKSILVAVKDPLGTATRYTPDSRTGATLTIDSDYTDQPLQRREYDSFGRVLNEFVTPEGESEVLVVSHGYDYPSGALRASVARFATSDPNSAIRSAKIFGGFGQVWKEIFVTPGNYAGVIRYSDPSQHLTRTSQRVDCDLSPSCEGFSGEIEPAQSMIHSDALGRPVRIDTPDGTSILRYSSIAGNWGLSPLDAILEKDGNGNLTQRARDGARLVWVDECENTVDTLAGDLTGVACGPADTTRYTYEASGELFEITDAVGVENSNFANPDHRLRFTYDTLGRRIRTEDPDLHGTGFTSQQYGDAGQILLSTNARDESRSFEYDALGRLESVDAPGAEDDFTVEYQPTQLQRWKDSSPYYERESTYDSWGRLEQSKLSVVVAAGGTCQRV